MTQTHTPVKRGKCASALRMIWRQRSLQLFVLFGVAYLIIFSYIPMMGILMAFKNYKISSGIRGLFTSPWVGMKYFVEFYTDYNFWSIIRNTLVMSLIKMAFTFPLPILLALVLNEVRNVKIKKIVQTTSYLPYFISWVIVVGFAQLFLQFNGVINVMLQRLGVIDKAIPFLTGEKYFLPIAVVTACWKDMGWWAILFLAAITGIDPTLYEAAEIDGAGRLQRIWHITMSGIRGTVTVVLILALGNLLGGGLSGSNFEQAYLIGNDGNNAVSEIVQTYVMKMGLSKGRYPYAAAISLCQSVISVFLVLTSNFVSKKASGNSLF
ncbi:MAG: ABC transporter permease subunit [Oscillospiraceae bacterium]|jgi:putative aldouronate transport system permease protein|nr:ABC transporter permease subunit [Oscillospiraceae bacterium]